MLNIQYMDCLELIQFQEQSGNPVPGWLPKIMVVSHLWRLCFTPNLTIMQKYNISSYPAHLCQLLSAF